LIGPRWELVVKQRVFVGPTFDDLVVPPAKAAERVAGGEGSDLGYSREAPAKVCVASIDKLVWLYQS